MLEGTNNREYKAVRTKMTILPVNLRIANLIEMMKNVLYLINCSREVAIVPRLGLQVLQEIFSQKSRFLSQFCT